MNYQIKDNPYMNVTNQSIETIVYDTSFYTKPKLINIVEKENHIEVTYSRELLLSEERKTEIYKVIYGRHDGSKEIQYP